MIKGNISRVWDATAESLVVVFAQLEQMGVKRAAYRDWPTRSLNKYEKAKARRQLRHDLKASWKLCKPKTRQTTEQ